MESNVQAIYEKGVLRPLVPLDLREQEVVSLAIERAQPNGDQRADDALAQQQQAIQVLLRETAQLPLTSAQGAFSNRDHDQILYGRQK